MTDAQIDTDPVRKPMGMSCRSCNRPLTNASVWTAWGAHDCERQARLDQGTERFSLPSPRTRQAAVRSGS